MTRLRLKTARRWLQVRLRTLVLAMLVLGPLLGWGGPKAYRAVERWRHASRPAPRDAWLNHRPLEATFSAGDDWRTWSSFPESEPPDVR